MKTKSNARSYQLPIGLPTGTSHLSKSEEGRFHNVSSNSLEYPPLIKKLSGIISENDLKRLAQDDDKVKYILREKA
jgi:hypothetical protein